MRISIPKPCTEILNNENYCSKCKHHITDFSNQELKLSDLNNQKMKCGIFSKDQLYNSNKLSKIYNIMLFSTLGLISSFSNAQEIKSDSNSDSNDRIIKSLEKFKFKFKLTDEQPIEKNHTETFRLMINDNLILSEFKVDEEYTIEFEAEKDAEIMLKIISNRRNFMTEKMYFTSKLPSTITFKYKDISIKNYMLGKYILKPQTNVTPQNIKKTEE